jgi:EmrB/QacA subfamily drug resistance transporter
MDARDASAPTPPDALAAQRAAFRTVFPGVMLAMFLASADQTILAAAIPAIAGALGNFEDVSWLAAGYLMAAMTAAPIYGHLGDRFGRRRMLFVALAVFVLASVACAAATSLAWLIVARSMQGLGGGGLMMLSQALISEQVPPRERGRYQGYFAGLYALSSTIGPVLGGYLTQHASWRAVFLINLPLGAIAALLARRVPASPGHRTPGFRPDVLGTALFVTGAVTLLYALSSGGHRIAWSSPLLLALVATGAGAFALLAWWEHRASDPIIPVRLLVRPAVWRQNVVVLLFAASLFALVLYLPLYLQMGRGSGVGESGTMLLPVTLAIAATATLTGWMITRTGHLTPFPIAGLAVATVAFATLALSLRVVSTPTVLGLVMLGAAGLGTVMPTAQVLVQGEAGRESLGSAMASISVSRSFGGALGSALVGALLVIAIGGHDPTFAELLAHKADDRPRALDALSAEQRAQVTERLDDAFRMVFAAIAALTAAGTLVAWRVPRRRL